MLRLFREAGMPRRRPPKLQCGAFVGDAPQILSPLRDVTYTLRRSRQQENIALNATAAGGVKELYWFAGHTFIGRVAAQKSLPWRPELDGWYALSVVDDRGQATARDIRVELVPY